MVERVTTGVIGLNDKIQGGFVPNSVNFLTGKTGTGKCVSPDTPVLLSNGSIKTAEDIFKEFAGDFIKDDAIYIPVNGLRLFAVSKSSLKISEADVQYIYRQKISEKVVKITTESNRQVEVTKEHPFLSLEQGETVFKKGGSLKAGDYIAVPREIKIRETYDELSEDLAKFLAFQIAEGDEWDKKSYYLRFHNEDTEKIKEYCRISEAIFDYEPRLCLQEGKTPCVRIFSKDAMGFLGGFGFIPAMGSRYKDIPNVVLASSDKVVASFLRAFYDCEGSVSIKNPEIELTTASFNVANKVLYMLLRFGIVGRLKEEFKMATNGRRIKRKYYTIVISGANGLRAFSDKVGFDDSLKSDKLSRHLAKKPNTNVDVVPGIGHLLRKIRGLLKIPAPKMGLGTKQTVYMYEWGKRNPSRDMLNKFLEVFRINLYKGKNAEAEFYIKKLESLANSEIFWDKIKKIEVMEPKYNYVYDFTVGKNHTFISGTGGIITHNTAFALSFLYDGALKGEPGLYITTEESENDLKEDVKAMFGWDLGGLEKQGMIKFLSIKPVIPSRVASDDDLSRLTRLYIFDLGEKINQVVTENNIKRLVLDSVSIIEMFVKDDYLKKVAIMQLADKLKDLKVTSLLTGTVPEESQALSAGGVIEFVADSVIKLDFVPVSEEFKRTLTVRKMRRTDHSILIHPFEITKSGVKVVEII